MTDEQLAEPEEPETTAAETEPPQYGVGPFTIREIVLASIWLVAFIVSFFPLFVVRGPIVTVTFAGSLWSVGLDWILTIGIPTVAVFLLVLRRLSPQGIRRVGSLGIDQFASVAFSVAATVWLTTLWADVARAIGGGVGVYGWVAWVEFVLMLAGVVLTVFGPLIPPFSQDFRGRPEVTAHRNASPVRAVEARPKPEPVFPDYADPFAPPADEAAPDAAAASGAAYSPTTGLPADSPAADPQYARGNGDTGAYPRRGAVVGTDAAAAAPAAQDAPSAEQDAPSADQAAQAPVQQQAFWALAPVERDVHDDRGVPIFRIGPTAWALVIEDRGSVYVIRHEDGRVGYLHDVSGVTRG